MKRVFCFLTAALLGLALTACGSTLKDGSKITDFKASVDANAKMYDSQADVMWNAQEASKACFTKASTDVQIALCAMKAQSTDFAQALAGRPAPNRNPSTAPEVAGDVGKKAVDGLTAVGVAKAVASGVESATDVQAQAPVVVRPEVVRPEVVLVP